MAASHGPAEALERLMQGNRRFAAGQALNPNRDGGRRAALAAGQRPFAAILGCVDSRVPPELVFDQGLGDLFVIRSAGQALDEAVLGSLEFGVLELGLLLVLVLGHSRCGALLAALEAPAGAPVEGEGHLAGLLAGLRPAAAAGRRLPGDPLENAVRANVVGTVERLRRLPALAGAVQAGRLVVAGGVYDLASGAVELLAEGVEKRRPSAAGFSPSGSDPRRDVDGFSAVQRGTDTIGVGVGAVIVDPAGRLFLARRGPLAKNERGLWEFPGGSVEYGERLVEALAREMREEYGIEIAVGELLDVVDHLLPEEGQHWVSPTFICRITAGEPEIREPGKCAEIGWFAPQAVPPELTVITRQNLTHFRAQFGV